MAGAGDEAVVATIEESARDEAIAGARRLATIAELVARRAHQITYACKSCGGVSIRAEHADALPLGLLTEPVAQQDAKTLLRVPADDPRPRSWTPRGRCRRTGLTGIADEHADGLLAG